MSLKIFKNIKDPFINDDNSVVCLTKPTTTSITPNFSCIEPDKSATTEALQVTPPIIASLTKNLDSSRSHSDSGKSSSCSPTLLDCSFDSGIAGVLDSNDMQLHKRIQQCQRILLALARDREHFCTIRNRLSKITDRRKKQITDNEYFCNVCCAEINPEDAKTFVKCYLCQKHICRSIKCADWLAKTAQWECELCQTSKESMAQTSSWVADQISFHQEKFVYPLRARSEVFIPISECNDSSIHFESVSQIGANSAIVTAEQKLKIREYVEEVVANLLGGNLDTISVNQLSKSENYLNLFYKYHSILSNIFINLENVLTFYTQNNKGDLPAPKTNGHLKQNGSVIRNNSEASREVTPTSTNSPDFTDISETRLRLMIQKIIAETVNMAPLSTKHAVSEISLDRRSKTTDNMSLTNGHRYRTEHYFEPKIYQDLLATAVLNKIVDKQLNNHDMLESSSNMTHVDDGGGGAVLDQNFNIENQSTTSGSSVEPQSDCSYTEMQHILNANDDKTPDLIISAGRESVMSDYLASHMVPLPDLSTMATESEEDDYMSVTSSAVGDGTWENNWLFKKKKSTLGGAAAATSVGMLVPDPKDDIRAQIGDKTADEVSDLSELGSDTDDSLDILRTKLDPINDRLINKHLIGGQNNKLVLDELIERSSMISNTLPTDLEQAYTETCNEHVIDASATTEAINTDVNSQSNNNLMEQEESEVILPPAGFEDSNSNTLTAGDDFTESDGCTGFSTVEILEPDVRAPSVVEILAAMALGPMLAVPAIDQPTALTISEFEALTELKDLALAEIKERSLELTPHSLSVIPEEPGEHLIDLKNFPTPDELNEEIRKDFERGLITAVDFSNLESDADINDLETFPSSAESIQTGLERSRPIIQENEICETTIEPIDENVKAVSEVAFSEPIEKTIEYSENNSKDMEEITPQVTEVIYSNLEHFETNHFSSSLIELKLSKEEITIPTSTGTSENSRSDNNVLQNAAQALENTDRTISEVMKYKTIDQKEKYVKEDMSSETAIETTVESTKHSLQQCNLTLEEDKIIIISVTTSKATSEPIEETIKDSLPTVENTSLADTASDSIPVLTEDKLTETQAPPISEYNVPLESKSVTLISQNSSMAHVDSKVSDFLNPLECLKPDTQSNTSLTRNKSSQTLVLEKLESTEQYNEPALDLISEKVLNEKSISMDTQLSDEPISALASDKSSQTSEVLESKPQDVRKTLNEQFDKRSIEKTEIIDTAISSGKNEDNTLESLTDIIQSHTEPSNTSTIEDNISEKANWEDLLSVKQHTALELREQTSETVLYECLKSSLEPTNEGSSELLVDKSPENVPLEYLQFNKQQAEYKINETVNESEAGKQTAQEYISIFKDDKFGKEEAEILESTVQPSVESDLTFKNKTTLSEASASIIPPNEGYTLTLENDKVSETVNSECLNVNTQSCEKISNISPFVGLKSITQTSQEYTPMDDKMNETPLSRTEVNKELSPIIKDDKTSPLECLTSDIPFSEKLNAALTEDEIYETANSEGSECDISPSDESIHYLTSHKISQTHMKDSDHSLPEDIQILLSTELESNTQSKESIPLVIMNENGGSFQDEDTAILKKDKNSGTIQISKEYVGSTTGPQQQETNQAPETEYAETEPCQIVEKSAPLLIEDDIYETATSDEEESDTQHTEDFMPALATTETRISKRNKEYPYGIQNIEISGEMTLECLESSEQTVKQISATAPTAVPRIDNISEVADLISENENSANTALNIVSILEGSISENISVISLESTTKPSAELTAVPAEEKVAENALSDYLKSNTLPITVAPTQNKNSDTGISKNFVPLTEESTPEITNDINLKDTSSGDLESTIETFKCVKTNPKEPTDVYLESLDHSESVKQFPGKSMEDVNPQSIKEPPTALQIDDKTHEIASLECSESDKKSEGEHDVATSQEEAQLHEQCIKVQRNEDTSEILQSECSESIAHTNPKLTPIVTLKPDEQRTTILEGSQITEIDESVIQTNFVDTSSGNLESTFETLNYLKSDPKESTTVDLEALDHSESVKQWESMEDVSPQCLKESTALQANEKILEIESLECSKLDTKSEGESIMLDPETLDHSESVKQCIEEYMEDVSPQSIKEPTALQSNDKTLEIAALECSKSDTKADLEHSIYQDYTLPNEQCVIVEKNYDISEIAQSECSEYITQPTAILAGSQITEIHKSVNPSNFEDTSLGNFESTAQTLNSLKSDPKESTTVDLEALDNSESVKQCIAESMEDVSPQSLKESTALQANDKTLEIVSSECSKSDTKSEGASITVDPETLDHSESVKQCIEESTEDVSLQYLKESTALQTNDKTLEIASLECSKSDVKSEAESTTVDPETIDHSESVKQCIGESMEDVSPQSLKESTALQANDKTLEIVYLECSKSDTKSEGEHSLAISQDEAQPNEQCIIVQTTEISQLECSESIAHTNTPHEQPTTVLEGCQITEINESVIKNNISETDAAGVVESVTNNIETFSAVTTDDKKFEIVLECSQCDKHLEEEPNELPNENKTPETPPASIYQTSGEHTSVSLEDKISKTLPVECLLSNTIKITEEAIVSSKDTVPQDVENPTAVIEQFNLVLVENKTFEESTMKFKKESTEESVSTVEENHSISNTQLIVETTPARTNDKQPENLPKEFCEIVSSQHSKFVVKTLEESTSESKEKTKETKPSQSLISEIKNTENNTYSTSKNTISETSLREDAKSITQPTEQSTLVSMESATSINILLECISVIDPSEVDIPIENAISETKPTEELISGDKDFQISKCELSENLTSVTEATAESTAIPISVSTHTNICSMVIEPMEISTVTVANNTILETQPTGENVAPLNEKSTPEITNNTVVDDTSSRDLESTMKTLNSVKTDPKESIDMEHPESVKQCIDQSMEGAIPQSIKEPTASQTYDKTHENASLECFKPDTKSEEKHTVSTSQEESQPNEQCIIMQTNDDTSEIVQSECSNSIGSTSGKFTPILTFKTDEQHTEEYTTIPEGSQINESLIQKNITETAPTGLAEPIATNIEESSAITTNDNISETVLQCSNSDKHSEEESAELPTENKKSEKAPTCIAKTSGEHILVPLDDKISQTLSLQLLLSNIKLTEEPIVSSKDTVPQVVEITQTAEELPLTVEGNSIAAQTFDTTPAKSAEGLCEIVTSEHTKSVIQTLEESISESKEKTIETIPSESLISEVQNIEEDTTEPSQNTISETPLREDTKSITKPTDQYILVSTEIKTSKTIPSECIPVIDPLEMCIPIENVISETKPTEESISGEKDIQIFKIELSEKLTSVIESTAESTKKSISTDTPRNMCSLVLEPIEISTVTVAQSNTILETQPIGESISVNTDNKISEKNVVPLTKESSLDLESITEALNYPQTEPKEYTDVDLETLENEESVKKCIGESMEDVIPQSSKEPTVSQTSDKAFEIVSLECSKPVRKSVGEHAVAMSHREAAQPNEQLIIVHTNDDISEIVQSECSESIVHTNGKLTPIVTFKLDEQTTVPEGSKIMEITESVIQNNISGTAPTGVVESETVLKCPKSDKYTEEESVELPKETYETSPARIAQIIEEDISVPLDDKNTQILPLECLLSNLKIAKEPAVSLKDTVSQDMKIAQTVEELPLTVEGNPTAATEQLNVVPTDKTFNTYTMKSAKEPIEESVATIEEDHGILSTQSIEETTTALTNEKTLEAFGEFALSEHVKSVIQTSEESSAESKEKTIETINPESLTSEIQNREDNTTAPSKNTISETSTEQYMILPTENKTPKTIPSEHIDPSGIDIPKENAISVTKPTEESISGVRHIQISKILATQPIAESLSIYTNNKISEKNVVPLNEESTSKITNDIVFDDTSSRDIEYNIETISCRKPDPKEFSDVDLEILENAECREQSIEDVIAVSIKAPTASQTFEISPLDCSKSDTKSEEEHTVTISQYEAQSNEQCVINVQPIADISETVESECSESTAHTSEKLTRIVMLKPNKQPIEECTTIPEGSQIPEINESVIKKNISETATTGVVESITNNIEECSKSDTYPEKESTELQKENKTSETAPKCILKISEEHISVPLDDKISKGLPIECLLSNVNITEEPSVSLKDTQDVEFTQAQIADECLSTLEENPIAVTEQFNSLPTDKEIFEASTMKFEINSTEESVEEKHRTETTSSECLKLNAESNEETAPARTNDKTFEKAPQEFCEIRSSEHSKSVTQSLEESTADSKEITTETIPLEPLISDIPNTQGNSTAISNNTVSETLLPEDTESISVDKDFKISETEPSEQLISITESTAESTAKSISVITPKNISSLFTEPMQLSIVTVSEVTDKKILEKNVVHFTKESAHEITNDIVSAEISSGELESAIETTNCQKTDRKESTDVELETVEHPESVKQCIEESMEDVIPQYIKEPTALQTNDKILQITSLEYPKPDTKLEEEHTVATSQNEAQPNVEISEIIESECLKSIEHTPMDTLIPYASEEYTAKLEESQIIEISESVIQKNISETAITVVESILNDIETSSVVTRDDEIIAPALECSKSDIYPEKESNELPKENKSSESAPACNAQTGEEHICVPLENKIFEASTIKPEKEPIEESVAIAKENHIIETQPNEKTTPARTNDTTPKTPTEEFLIKTLEESIAEGKEKTTETITSESLISTIQNIENNTTVTSQNTVSETSLREDAKSIIQPTDQSMLVSTESRISKTIPSECITLTHQLEIHIPIANVISETKPTEESISGDKDMQISKIVLSEKLNSEAESTAESTAKPISIETPRNTCSLVVEPIEISTVTVARNVILETEESISEDTINKISEKSVVPFNAESTPEITNNIVCEETSLGDLEPTIETLNCQKSYPKESTDMGLETVVHDESAKQCIEESTEGIILQSMKEPITSQTTDKTFEISSSECSKSDTKSKGEHTAAISQDESQPPDEQCTILQPTDDISEIVQSECSESIAHTSGKRTAIITFKPDEQPTIILKSSQITEIDESVIPKNVSENDAAGVVESVTNNSERSSVITTADKISETVLECSKSEKYSEEETTELPKDNETSETTPACTAQTLDDIVPRTLPSECLLSNTKITEEPTVSLKNTVAQVVEIIQTETVEESPSTLEEDPIAVKEHLNLVPTDNKIFEASAMKSEKIPPEECVEKPHSTETTSSGCLKLNIQSKYGKTSEKAPQELCKILLSEHSKSVRQTLNESTAKSEEQRAETIPLESSISEIENTEINSTAASKNNVSETSLSEDTKSNTQATKQSALMSREIKTSETVHLEGMSVIGLSERYISIENTISETKPTEKSISGDKDNQISELEPSENLTSVTESTAQSTAKQISVTTSSTSTEFNTQSAEPFTSVITYEKNYETVPSESKKSLTEDVTTETVTGTVITESQFQPAIKFMPADMDTKITETVSLTEAAGDPTHSTTQITTSKSDHSTDSESATEPIKQYFAVTMDGKIETETATSERYTEECFSEDTDNRSSTTAPSKCLLEPTEKSGATLTEMPYSEITTSEDSENRTEHIDKIIAVPMDENISESLFSECKMTSEESDPMVQQNPISDNLPTGRSISEDVENEISETIPTECLTSVTSNTILETSTLIDCKSITQSVEQSTPVSADEESFEIVPAVPEYTTTVTDNVNSESQHIKASISVDTVDTAHSLVEDLTNSTTMTVPTSSAKSIITPITDTSAQDAPLTQPSIAPFVVVETVTKASSTDLGPESENLDIPANISSIDEQVSFDENITSPSITRQPTVVEIEPKTVKGDDNIKETAAQIKDSVTTAQSLGSIAEREYKKWYNAVEMPNNPYAPEALKRRISGSQERFIDLPNISPIKEQNPLELLNKDKLDVDETDKRESNYRRYSRDYYINNSSTSSQTSTPRETPATPTKDNLENTKATISPTINQTDIDLYKAIPVQVVEDTTSSIDTISQQSIQSGNTTTSDDSDTIKIYDFKKQETTVLKESKTTFEKESVRDINPKERPTVLDFSRPENAGNVTTPTRGSTPTAFKFLQPKRRILDPSQVLSADEDATPQVKSPMEKPVIEQEVAQALPSVKALAKAFLMTTKSTQSENRWLQKAKTLSQGGKRKPPTPVRSLDPTTSEVVRVEDDVTITSDLSSLETDSSLVSKDVENTKDIPETPLSPTVDCTTTAITTSTSGNNSPVPVRQGGLKSNIAFFENLKFK